MTDTADDGCGGRSSLTVCLEWSSMLEMLEFLGRRLRKEVRLENLDDWSKEDLEDKLDMLLNEPVFIRECMPLWMPFKFGRSL